MNTIKFVESALEQKTGISIGEVEISYEVLLYAYHKVVKNELIPYENRKQVPGTNFRPDIWERHYAVEWLKNRINFERIKERSDNVLKVRLVRSRRLR